jgi:hypothetical protein
MSLLLSPEQLRVALSGLTLAEKTELLGLLEQRERLEAEAPPDTRPSIEETFGTLRDECAARSSNPAAYVEADDAHEAAVRRHSARLARERPRSAEPPTLAALWDEFQEVIELARHEGHAPAGEVVRPPEPPPPPQDPLERIRKATLPKATLRDIEDSKTRTAEERIYKSIRDEQDARFYRPQAPEVLSDFRGHAEPPLVPPTFPDS